MAVLYVDESGEEGFSPTSSDWLIVGGAIQRDHIVFEATKLAYDAFKSKHRAPNWHFHFQKASHNVRLGFIDAMRDTGLRAMAVAIYKPGILKPDNFRKRYFLYFYALRFLLEKATIWCRDHGMYDEMHVYLSSRRGLTVENLNEYLERVISSPFVKEDRMEWSFLRNKGIFIKPNEELRGLQIADCVVSSIGQAWEASEFGLYEPRFIKDLRPMFHHDDQTYARAIKIWPSVPTHLISGILE
ncbi:DUF3800 domain-containing protein [Mesorhizobium sp. C416B]|uniref:DUF3800 domain-containing protein n=1 Tax=unclassified Mesorhizobium TaxID=325217 RepID=UPI0003CE5E95|nr:MULTISPECIES: DUF3800 domain-containing protein [unclassified Mesorhizobium]ESX49398.1 hypothetical protein X762_10995 [Mesorhizobium sp. LSHC426A00]ESX55691.1 hypothetical protein X761_14005 [Mesorhizobium sp. LSHC424B00]ESX70519.1 hypothetical protein X758_16910 [Mesorhizobium sp. LSHC416B00]WJI61682.1 DUF3800 domain-containing protein [Mesorhizobium sp. C416B]